MAAIAVDRADLMYNGEDLGSWKGSCQLMPMSWKGKPVRILMRTGAEIGLSRNHFGRAGKGLLGGGPGQGGYFDPAGIVNVEDAVVKDVRGLL